MGRRKLETKKIENHINRQVTYAKRQNGLMKKAYELSVLCDIDIAVLAFSPAGKLTQFCNDDKIEDLITRYANIPQHERTKGKFKVEYLNKVAQILTVERGLEAPREGYEDLQAEVQELKSLLDMTVVQRNIFEQRAPPFPGNEYINSFNSSAQLLNLKSELLQGLKKIDERIVQLDRQLGPDVGQTTVQQSYFEMINGLLAENGLNVGSTDNSAPAMDMHNWEGVHNLDNTTSIMTDSEMREQFQTYFDMASDDPAGDRLNHLLSGTP